MSLIRIDRTKRIEADHALALRDMGGTAKAQETLCGLRRIHL